MTDFESRRAAAAATAAEMLDRIHEAGDFLEEYGAERLARREAGLIDEYGNEVQA